MDKRFQRFDNRLSKCLNPVTFKRDGKLFSVSCGRCDACLLQKANDWSFRLADEIAAAPYSLFFTLTYSNAFLPVALFDPKKMTYFSDNERNVRMAVDSHGVGKVKERLDGIEVYIQAQNVPITNFNYNGNNYLAYLSKRDIQLFKKNLRNLIEEHYGTTDNRQRTLRSYIIGEYGPTHQRPHYHGILFTEDKSVAEYCAKFALYQSWQMCDKTLFQNYISYCDTNTSLYVTQYVTSFSNLPSVYKSKEFAPFRLASKSPAIGFRSFDYLQVWKDVESGIFEYSKSVPSAERNYIFPFPAGVTNRLFPKCRRYSELSFSRLLAIYGKLYQFVVAKSFNEQIVINRFRSSLCPQDWYATKRCFETCLAVGCHPFHYVFVLDNFFYHSEMDKLRRFYEYQDTCAGDFKKIATTYINLSEFYHKSHSSAYLRWCLRFFLSPFGMAYEDINSTTFSVNTTEIQALQSVYDDIKEDMVKLPKAYAQTGIAPNNQIY